MRITLKMKNESGKKFLSSGRRFAMAVVMQKISRDEACIRGLPRYFTGQPCRHGHYAERYVAAPGSCVECQRRKNQRDRPLRAAWALSGSPAARARNRHKGHKTAARIGGYRPAPHERFCPPRPASGRCQCCGRKAKPVRPGIEALVLDHNHRTGRFRGWVCASCNARIERCKDDSVIQAYIAKNKKRVPGKT